MRRTRATGALVLALLPGLLTISVVTGPPTQAAPSETEERAPLWQSTLVSPDSAQGFVEPLRSFVDPTSGDVLTLVTDQHHPEASRRVRRTDGATGATLWEVGLGPRYSSATTMALDAEGERVVVATSTGRGHRLTSIGLDGEVDWTVRNRVGGDVADLEANPVTGTTCFTTLTGGRGAGPRVRNVWHLVCHDRAGKRAGSGRLRHRGLTDGPTALAVNPELSTWYVAGAHREGRRGSSTLLAAFREGGSRLWRASHDQRGRDARVDSIAVDLANNVIHLGGGSRAGATLLSWTADGGPKGDRAWSSGSTIPELVADVPRRRLLAVVQERRGAPSVVVLRPLGKQLRRFPHVGNHDAGARLAVDPDRRRVLVAGPRLVVSTWSGRLLWRGAGPAGEVHDLLVDGPRGRVLTLTHSYDRSSGRPVFALTAYPL